VTRNSGLHQVSIEYYANLLLLTFSSHRSRVRFFQRKIRLAEETLEPDRRLKLLRLCADWAADLLASSAEVAEEFAERAEIIQVQKEIAERYEQERLNQGQL